MRCSLLCLFAVLLSILTAPSVFAQDDDPRKASWNETREVATDAFYEGDYATAERLFRQLLGECSVFGADTDRCVRTTKQWLAMVLDQSGHQDEALGMLREIEGMIRRDDDPAHEQLFQVLSGIATISTQTGRLDDAEKAWGEVIALYAEEYGEDDFDLGEYYAALGDVQMQSGRLREAAATFDRMKALYLEHYDEDDEELLGVYQQIGDAQRQLGEYHDAAKNYGIALRMARKQWGDLQDYTISMWRGYTMCLINSGDLEGGLREAEAVYRVMLGRYGDGHYETLPYAMLVARVAITVGAWESANRALDAAQELVTENELADNFDRRAVLFEQWRLHERRGKSQAANEILDQLRDILK